MRADYTGVPRISQDSPFPLREIPGNSGTVTKSASNAHQRSGAFGDRPGISRYQRSFKATCN
jgi:hypothetical protein